MRATVKRAVKTVRRALGLAGIGLGLSIGFRAEAQVMTPPLSGIGTSIARKSTNVLQSGATSLANLNGNTNLYVWVTFNCPTNTAAVGTNTIHLQGAGDGVASTNWSTPSVDSAAYTLTFTNQGTNLITQRFKVPVDPFTAVRVYDTENTDTNDTAISVRFGQPNPGKQ